MSVFGKVLTITGLALGAYTLAIALIEGPLESYVPNCPVMFGFCKNAPLP